MILRLRLFIFTIWLLIPGQVLGQGLQLTPEALFAAIQVEAQKGQPQAMLNLGSLYEQGLGVARNFTQAMTWYQKTADAGSAEGYMRLGLCYEIGMGTASDMAKAVINYKKAVDMGFSSAQHKMAALYFSGQGVPKDEALGFDLLTKAAEAGNPLAANELAYIYLNGLFNQKADPGKAQTWFTKGAEGGNLEAMKNLAVMLKNEKKSDLTMALRWYLTAQKGGLQAPDLEQIISDLKKGLNTAQIQKAEKEADDWLAVYAQRTQPPYGAIN